MVYDSQTKKKVEGVFGVNNKHTILAVTSIKKQEVPRVGVQGRHERGRKAPPQASPSVVINASLTLCERCWPIGMVEGGASPFFLR